MAALLSTIEGERVGKALESLQKSVERKIDNNKRHIKAFRALMACEDTLYMEEEQEEQEEQGEQEEQENDDDDDDDEHDDNDGRVKTVNNIITHAVGDNLDLTFS